jgi:bifunctional ADP-heptose synthase (sugar kinase/adenylyltransferase)
VDSAQLLALAGALRGKTVAVVGDVVADEFVYGRVARVSREAPVLILEYDSTAIVPGGAGNAANNVARRWASPRSPPWSGVTSRDSGRCARCTSGSIRAASCAWPRVQPR